MKRRFDDYYLGLDIGTSSVGWAVTDQLYKVKKINGKAMWGTRLFEEGDTAETRRLHRSATRRNDRKKQRIKLLQEIIAEDINKVDPGFYIRLAESKYWLEDKKIEDEYTLFNDDEYTDIDYYKEFPTIYHLREKLIKSKEKHDIRLYYLAIHHMVKHRGHFLFEGESFDDVQEIDEEIKRFVYMFNEEFEAGLEIINIYKVKELLKDDTLTKTDKKRQMKELMNAKTKSEQKFCELLVGSSVALADLFEDESLKDAEKNKIQFGDASYDEAYSIYEEQLQERMYYINLAKSIYDWGILANLLNEEQYLSSAKVALYDKHKTDLKRLKQLVKEEAKEKYKVIFVQEGTDNYSAYIGHVKSKGKRMSVKQCTKEAFYKFLKKQLKNINGEHEVWKSINAEMEQGTFMPKQRTKENGVIPYQIHLKELEVIVDKMTNCFPKFGKTDSSGYTGREKLLKVFTFKIPYYVGPLNDTHKNHKSGHCWIVKKSDDKIRPWNFEEVVDVDASEEQFIMRMTNKCTYLAGEDVLPKESLLYSEFMVLNELNNVKIDGEIIPNDIKLDIFEELFKKKKKVSQNMLKNYFKIRGIEGALTGIDGDFKSSMKAYIDFERILGECYKHTEMIEKIIMWHVIFGDGKKRLKIRIKREYGNILSKDQINKIVSLDYKGWGRLSKKFLTEIYHADNSTVDNISVSIMTMMRTKCVNLMKLLSYDYDYLTAIESFNEAMTTEEIKFGYHLVDELMISPKVKRGTWQTLQIINEIVKVTGKQPKKIFLEVARGAEEKKRTVTRKNRLIELYKKCQQQADCDTLRKSLDELNNSRLRSDRLYLYYTQMGRCMYTGEKIELDDLYDKNIYDIDHIFPQSKVKDDSLDNRVLVYKKSNADKTDVYPIDKTIQHENRHFWKVLLDKELISRKKFERLTRVDELSDSELSEFIARQLVETRQSTKAVAGLLKELYKEATIVYVKAGNVSSFRHKYEMLKCREVNDFHHAKDAYLNIVVGNVYDVKFTRNPMNFIKSRQRYSLNRMYDFKVERNGDVAWEVKGDKSIGIVKKQMKKNNILFTRYAYEEKGEMFDLMPVKAGKGQVPLKGSDERLKSIGRYGGYNRASGAYFTFVEHLDKRKKIRSFEFVPVYLARKIEKDKSVLEEYLTNDLELCDVRILLRKVKIGTVVDADGFRMHISGRTGDQIEFKGARQLILKEELVEYIRQVAKYNSKVKKYDGKLENVYEDISEMKNKELYEELLEKLRNRPYNTMLNSLVEKLENAEKNFKELEMNKQVEVLLELLHLFQCNSVNACLVDIKEGKKVGKLKISKNIITNGKSKRTYKIINQSVTGIFESSINLGEL